MPWDSGQFWIVTIAALASAISLLRPMMLAKRKAAGKCRLCAGADSAARRKLTHLTITGRRI